MKYLLLAASLLIGASYAEEWGITINSEPLKIHMNEEQSVPFVVTFPENTPTSRVLIRVSTTDPEVAVAIAPNINDSNNTGATYWNDSLVVKGIFLGRAEINLQISTDDGIIFKVLEVKVTKAKRLVDDLFTASVATLVSILYINFGCAMDWSVCKKTLKKPVGPAIGAFCQFLIMPMLSYGIGHLLFPDRPELQLGIFFTGISPSGGASNIWTVLLGGNLSLSVTMTTLGTIASLGELFYSKIIVKCLQSGTLLIACSLCSLFYIFYKASISTMPFWIFTLGKRIFDKSNVTVPYSRIAFLAVGLVIPLGLGYLIQQKLPRLSRLLVRIMKPFSIILVIFIIIFAVVTNIYLFKLFSWQIIVAGMGLSWVGFICGWIAMVIFRQPDVDVRAIAIETGIQNTGIAIFLLRFSLSQPAADLTTVIPVACAIMTPIPLAILWLIKLVFDRRKKKLAASMEKLQIVAEPVNATTPIAPMTILP